MKVESSGSEIKQMAEGSPSPVARSKRRGSVLRREALERLRQGNSELTLDEGGGGLHDGGGRGVPSGETLSSSYQLDFSTTCSLARGLPRF